MDPQGELNFDRGEMNPDEFKVWSALSGCKGEDLASKQSDIASVCQMSGRKVRDIIGDLIIKHKKLIASTPNRKRPGYFIVQNEKEGFQGAERLKGQAVKIIQRAAVLIKTTEKEMMKQVQLELQLEFKP